MMLEFFWDKFGHAVQFAGGFRGPGVLIKRSTHIVDLSVRRVTQRSRYLTKHPKHT